MCTNNSVLLSRKLNFKTILGSERVRGSWIAGGFFTQSQMLGTKFRDVVSE